MKTEYKHIHFEDISYMYPGRKTSVWLCSNNDDEVLGEIKWYSPWRQYCFFCKDSIILAGSCHTDIADFIKQLMLERELVKHRR